MNLTKIKKKKGFTLIELMAVIAIIAILAAVLVPTVTGYIERAKKTAVLTQARNVVSAVETYNATAVVDDQVKLATTLTNIKTTIGQDLLADVAKLSDTMTYATIKHINEDTNSIKNIEIDSAGKIKAYKSNATYTTETDGTTLSTPIKVEFK